MITHARLSTKQKDSILDAVCRINLWEGAIRSGKTIASILAWLLYVRNAPPGPLAIIGKTRDSIGRNVLDVIADIAPGAIVFNRGAPTCRILGRLVHVIGANDAKAEKVLRGLTLAGAYVDEVTVIPEGFFRQLLGRLSVPGAKLFGTTNPDTPSHWLMKDFIKKLTLPVGDPDRPDMVSFHFELTDNPGLEPDYVAGLMAEFTGLWFLRFIRGLWVAAEGAIYSMLEEQKHTRPAPPKDRWQAALVGIDFGTSNPTHALLVVLAADEEGELGLYVVAEWEHDGRAKGQLSTAQQSDRLMKWAAPLLADTGLDPIVVLDPSAAPLRVQMRADGWPGLRSADNRVDVGLQAVASLFAGARLFIDPVACPVLWDQLCGYVWDEKALVERGIEQPVKLNDHGCDALRYAIMAARMIWRVWLPALAAEDTRQAA
ncbi:phage terminase large subunit [Lentzea sp. NBRC 105346]|uniref:PBSX family phage terminase large subunit n=1 Tax=Lentzea sp. NBRC 105346 TaxID=3032205 RepID=UPI0024A25865|nr:terminase family protein [Lentzea sp. NBRC 105346]GLZ34878.1 phage terminase large subunit [Lentzea sp. NBRC 105346]